MVGERGFEPPTPWSRTRKVKIPNASTGVAKGPEHHSFSPSIVPSCTELSVESWWRRRFNTRPNPRPGFGRPLLLDQRASHRGSTLPPNDSAEARLPVLIRTAIEIIPYAPWRACNRQHVLAISQGLMIEEIRSCARENLWCSPAPLLAWRDLVAGEQFQLPLLSLKRSQRKRALSPLGTVSNFGTKLFKWWAH